MRKLDKEERFEDIYCTFKNEVYKISLYYTKDSHISEDITQKVFYEFYQHFENVDMERARAYLLRAARNSAFNWLRDTKREVNGEHLDVVGNEELFLRNVEEEYIQEENKQEAELLVGRIMEGLRKENESWYQIMNLIFCMEKSHDEVAEELGLTKDVLYSKVYRAKKWIQKNFKDEYIR